MTDKPKKQEASTPSLYSGNSRDIFQGSSLGVVESSIDRRVVFANRAALEMIGVKSYQGLSLDDAFTDGNAQDVLEAQLKERRAGRVGNYTSWITRLDKPGMKIEVDITGLPLYDDSGEVVGSLGIFRRLDQERVTAKIRELTLNRPHSLGMLDAVAEQVRGLLPYDLMLVSRMNPRDRESMTYYTQPRFETEVPRVWFALDEPQWRHMVETRASRIDDFNQVMAHDPWKSLENEPMVVQMKAMKLQTTLWRVIRRPDETSKDGEGEPIGTIALMSSEPNAYGEQDRRLFDALPLTEAVLRAQDNDARRIQNAKLELLKELNHCATVDEAGKLLATRLLAMFDWSHIAVYRVDYSADRIRLVNGGWKERSGSGVRLRAGLDMNVNYSQDIDAGVLGQVVARKACRNIPDVTQEPVYLRGPNLDKVLSELACPIRFDPDDRVRFIINVNDDQLNAFSREDERMLEELAGEVAGTMQRISHLAFLMECFDQASDPIIATDARLRIRKANPAAAGLLGVGNASEVKGCITDYFVDPLPFERLKPGHVGNLGELAVRPRGEGQPAGTAWVSCKEFPQSLGGYVFLARDLKDMRREVQMEMLENAAYEIAIDTRTPLTLATSRLEKLRSRCESKDDQEKFTEVLSLLGRVRNAYTRLAMFNMEARKAAASVTALNLSGELRAFIGALPDEDENRVALNIEDDGLEIEGDHNQLGAVFGTLLASMLRSAPEDGQLLVRMNRDGDSALLRFEGWLAPMEHARTRRDALGEAYRDLRLANPLIRTIMDAHGGAFTQRHEPDGRVEFALRFPLREAAP